MRSTSPDADRVHSHVIEVGNRSASSDSRARRRAHGEAGRRRGRSIEAGRFRCPRNTDTTCLEGPQALVREDVGQDAGLVATPAYRDGPSTAANARVTDGAVRGEHVRGDTAGRSLPARCSGSQHRRTVAVVSSTSVPTHGDRCPYLPDHGAGVARIGSTGRRRAERHPRADGSTPTSRCSPPLEPVHRGAPSPCIRGFALRVRYVR